MAGPTQPHYSLLRGTNDITQISPKTLIELIEGESKENLHHIVIDCRSLEDFERDHIEGATHVRTAKDMLNHVQSTTSAEDSNVSMIFYCQDSLYRAPISGLRFQQMYEEKKIALPRIFILKEGYEGYLKYKRIMRSLKEPMHLQDETNVSLTRKKKIGASVQYNTRSKRRLNS